MEIKDISIVITTYKSENKIYNCLNSLPKLAKIIVVENSKDEKFKEEILKRYPHIDCILTGGNKGYSVANNIGLSKVTTNFALILNPDTIVAEKTFDNFLIQAKIFPDFWLMGPVTDEFNNVTLKKDIFETNYIKGHAMFFNVKKFNNIFFDENYFLYLEEIDLCKRVLRNKGKIYQVSTINVDHEGARSVQANSELELEKNRNWHWMWSTFYFNKKHKGFVLALIVVIPKLLSSFAKFIFFSLMRNNKKSNIYFCRLSGLINSILGKKSWYRPSID